MINLGISGVCGRMGSRILNLAKADKEFNVVLGLEKDNHPRMGEVVDGIEVTNYTEKISSCDCLIEFSSPQATLAHINTALKYKKCVVIGTTGFNEEDISVIRESSSKIPILISPNMSVGVNVLFKLVKEAGKILKNYKIYMEEAHHIHKKDAPSGTAKKLADILNKEGFGIKYENIVSIREDEIVGDHSVVFKSDVDQIELSHSAKTRDIFAQGALTAAKWIINKSKGLYSMDDVLFGGSSGD